MEIDSHALTTCEVVKDGGAISLGFVDTTGNPATIRLPLDQVGALAMTLPGLINKALQTRFGDQSLRYAYPLASWVLEQSSDSTQKQRRRQLDRGDPRRPDDPLGRIKNREGDLIGIPYGANIETCPVRAYKSWLTVSGITSGPAFRAIDRHGNMSGEALTDKAMARIVKRSILAAEMLSGATTEEAKTAAARFAGHSLRSASPHRHRRTMRPGRPSSASCVTRNSTPSMKYIRVGQLYKKNAAGMAGL